MSTDYKSPRMADPPFADRVEGPGTIETHLIDARTPGTIDAPIGVSLEERDAIRWGPILAGVVTALAVMLFLSALGLALGFSAFTGSPDGNSAGNWLTAAGIWGGLSLLLSFFFSGWMAGRGSSAGPDRNGLLNGFVAGAATLLFIFWLAATTLTNALGFVGSTIGTVVSAAPAAIEAVDATDASLPAVPPVDAENVADTAVDAAADPGAVVDEVVPADVQAQAADVVENAGDAAAGGAWGTFLVILLALAAAAIGGKVGQPNQVFMTRTRGATSA